jgi:hypothetical protein
MIMTLCSFGPHLSDLRTDYSILLLLLLLLGIGHAGRGRRVFFSCLVLQGVIARYPHYG